MAQEKKQIFYFTIEMRKHITNELKQPEKSCRLYLMKCDNDKKSKFIQGLETKNKKFIAKLDKYIDENQIEEPGQPDYTTVTYFITPQYEVQKFITCPFQAWNWGLIQPNPFCGDRKYAYAFEFLLVEFWTHGSFKRDPKPYTELSKFNVEKETGLALAIQWSKIINKPIPPPAPLPPSTAQLAKLYPYMAPKEKVNPVEYNGEPEKRKKVYDLDKMWNEVV